MKRKFWICLIVISTAKLRLHAQQKSVSPEKFSDSVLENKDLIYKDAKHPNETDSLEEQQKKRYRNATLYSVILPGAGQVYNKKYWKVPLVYAGLGISAYFYFSNKIVFQQTQYALVVTINQSPPDSVAKVQPYLQPFVKTGDTNGLITGRDEARKNEDYSVLFFFMFYALNIVDATVDAHLKDFNVSSNLSFQVKPVLIPAPTPVIGMMAVFNIHKAIFPLRYLD
jgi:hypothetical protein